MATGPAFARARLEQAEADPRAVGLSASGHAYEWACFQAQQAGEKALKAYLYARGFTSTSPTPVVSTTSRLDTRMAWTRMPP